MADCDNPDKMVNAR